MFTKEKLLDRIKEWKDSVAKKSYMRCFDTSLGEGIDYLISIFLVSESSKELIYMYEQLSDNLRTSTGGLLVYRVESHSHTFLRVKSGSFEAEVILGCLSPAQVPKDEDLSHFLDSVQTGLKPSRDAVLLRQLLKPRLWAWFNHWTSKRDPGLIESFRVALKILVKWSESRQIFGDGFLTREIILVMLCSLCPNRPSSPFLLLQRFFRHFSSQFEFNEASVAAHVCGLTGTVEDGYYGSVINEEEGIDSDADEDLRRMRLARKISRNISETDPEDSGEPQHSHLAISANENDDVHPHKRLRFELGQIRDIRRFYAVENTRVQKISIAPDKKFKNFLDFLDVITVCHPSPGYDLPEGEHVNIAVRTLESHKKLILQELIRANMLVSDCVGDDFTLLSEILTKEKYLKNNIQIFCKFEIESKEDEIACVVASVVDEQVWFLVQELQATHGVMVIPIPAKNNSTEISVGLNFVKEEPYGATEGTEIDLLGPMSRVMLRCKKLLKERPEYEEKLRGKFIVRSRVVRNG